MKTEAETGMSPLQAKELRGRPQTPAAREGAQSRGSLGAPTGNQRCRHLDFRLLASRAVRGRICVVVKAPSLQQFVAAALGNGYSDRAVPPEQGPRQPFVENKFLK